MWNRVLNATVVDSVQTGGIKQRGERSCGQDVCGILFPTEGQPDERLCAACHRPSQEWTHFSPDQVSRATQCIEQNYTSMDDEEDKGKEEEEEKREEEEEEEEEDDDIDIDEEEASFGDWTTEDSAVIGEWGLLTKGNEEDDMSSEAETAMMVDSFLRDFKNVD